MDKNLVGEGKDLAGVTTESLVSPERGLLPCEWCADPKIPRRFLSDDAGCTIEAANGREGSYTLSHAWDDTWWPCLASGKQVKIFIGSVSQWRSIETAPKDGTWHVVTRIKEGRLLWWYRVRWSPSKAVWTTGDGIVEPTHWLPLPDPPALNAPEE